MHSEEEIDYNFWYKCSTYRFIGDEVLEWINLYGFPEDTNECKIEIFKGKFKYLKPDHNLSYLFFRVPRNEVNNE